MRGFLLVFALVAVAAAIYHQWWLRREPSSLELCRKAQKNLATNLEVYASDYAGLYPERLDQLVPQYTKALPTCPCTLTFTYKDYECRRSPDIYTFSCVGDNHAHQYGKPSPNYPRFSSLEGSQDPE